MDPQLEFTRDELAQIVNIMRQSTYAPGEAYQCQLAGSVVAKAGARISEMEGAKAPPEAPAPDTAAAAPAPEAETPNRAMRRPAQPRKPTKARKKKK